MTTEELIIAVVRVLGSLPVLRWPLAGGIFAMLIDLSDLFMMNLLQLGGVGNYQDFDKYLDQVYMLTFLVVALRWAAVPRGIAVVLYAYRLAGFVAFEITGTRELLLAFPNLFEVWFIFVAGIQFFKIKFDYSPKQIAVAALPLISIKMFQEYVLHYGLWLEGFTAVEAVEAIWDWLTSPFR
ncbi:MAG: hypothetical protein ACE5FA_04540 [Dehalococcoidia bacterium]